MGKYLDMREFYFARYVQSGQTAQFEYTLQKPLVVGLDTRAQIAFCQCLLPGRILNFPSGYVVIDEKLERKTPSGYVAGLGDLVKLVNEQLRNDLPPLEYVQGCVKVTLPSKRSLRLSPELGEVLLGKDTQIQNNTSDTITYSFEAGDFLDIYYLTCDLLQASTVNRVEIPVLFTLVVSIEGSFKESLIVRDDTQGKMPIKPGYYTRINFTLCDKEGKPVRLSSGIVFIHLKICT
jgi:hypothetical protein